MKLLYFVSKRVLDSFEGTFKIGCRRQISDLTSIVLALTENISSSTNECNGLNTVTNTNVTRSDTDIHVLQS